MDFITMNHEYHINFDTKTVSGGIFGGPKAFVKAELIPGKPAIFTMAEGDVMVTGAILGMM